MAKLSDRHIKNLPIPAKNDKFISDGSNLYLRLTTKGKKIFYYIYKKQGKVIKKSLGEYPILSLKEAREQTLNYNKLRYNNDITNINDYLKEQSDIKALENKFAFKSVYNEFANIKWSINPNNNKKVLEIDTALRNRNEIEKNVIPFIGNKQINEITKAEISLILRQRAKLSNVWAKRLRGFLKNIFDFAKSNGYIEFNIISDIEFKSIAIIKPTKHYRAITKEPYFTMLCNALYNNDSFTTKNILKFLLHIPLRVSNVLSLKWQNVSLDDKFIEIPREIMKVSDPNLPNFIMPLSDEVIRILKDQKELLECFKINSEFVFSTFTGKPTTNQTLNKELFKMGFNNEKHQRTHGFRQTYRTLIDENKAKDFSYEARELFLDHRVGNDVSLAYKSNATLIKELKEIVKWWSEFILKKIH